MTWIVTNEKHEIIAPEPLSYEQFTTPAGQRAQVVLNDGSVVWLNANSTLRYPSRFEKHKRKVELTGEAFFEVFHDAKRPFIVSTDKVAVKVLGTKFNVFAYKSSKELNVAIVEGSVCVCKGDETIHLKSHEIASLVDGRLVKSKYFNSEFLLWKEGIYAFDDMPFYEIAKKLELYYDIQIEQNNKSLAQFHFSGKFRQRDGVVSVLQTMQRVYHFTFTKDDQLNKITIR